MKYVDFNGNIAWYKEYKIFDHLGNVRSVLHRSSTDNNDKTYSVVAQYDYDAWGDVIWQNGNAERAKYIGKETDAESGDHNHGVRQYSDYVGRFLCPDGLWAKYIGWTPYQYSENNPICKFDDNGLFDKEAFAKAWSVNVTTGWQIQVTLWNIGAGLNLGSQTMMNTSNNSNPNETTKGFTIGPVQKEVSTLTNTNQMGQEVTEKTTEISLGPLTKSQTETIPGNVSETNYLISLIQISIPGISGNISIDPGAALKAIDPIGTIIDVVLPASKDNKQKKNTQKSNPLPSNVIVDPQNSQNNVYMSTSSKSE